MNWIRIDMNFILSTTSTQILNGRQSFPLLWTGGARNSLDIFGFMYKIHTKFSLFTSTVDYNSNILQLIGNWTVMCMRWNAFASLNRMALHSNYYKCLRSLSANSNRLYNFDCLHLLHHLHSPHLHCHFHFFFHRSHPLRCSPSNNLAFQLFEKNERENRKRLCEIEYWDFPLIQQKLHTFTGRSKAYRSTVVTPAETIAWNDIHFVDTCRHQSTQRVANGVNRTWQKRERL